MTDSIEVKNCSDDDILDFSDQICKVNNFRQATWSYFHDVSNCNRYINYLDEKLHISELDVRQTSNYRYTGNEDWFTTGKKCKLLKPGQEWQKGKIRVKLTLEFIPDEPEPKEIEQNNNKADESPLDEIRQQLTN